MQHGDIKSILLTKKKQFKTLVNHVMYGIDRTQLARTYLVHFISTWCLYTIGSFIIK